MIGFCAGIHLRNFVIDNMMFVQGNWKENPVLVICPSSNINELMVESALNYWKEKNLEVAFYHKDEDGKICNRSENLYGFILLRGNENKIGKNSYGRTIRAMRGTSIQSASIHIHNEYSRLNLLLEHELGHAFGLAHVEEKGHIMNPIYNYVGEKFYIP